MRPFFIAFIFVVSISAQAKLPDRVSLNVPLVKQGHALCGPATIEMIFRYWGITRYDQYDIAFNILKLNPESKRFVQSKILESEEINWKLYPGTGTINMREFLKRYATTKNHKFKTLSSNTAYADRQKLKVWGIVQRYLSNDIPVIVHQYWRGKGTNGHYRIVTGYDNYKAIVYLNDADQGRKIIQTYDQFFSLWNVDKPWLHYNAIAFNTSGERVSVRLDKY